MSRRPRSRRALVARLRGGVGLLVAVGYLAGLGTTTAGRGFALGVHVAVEHAAPASVRAVSERDADREGSGPGASAARPHGHDHTHAADLNASPHRHAEPGYAERPHTGHGPHRHVASTAAVAGTEEASVEVEPTATAASAMDEAGTGTGGVHTHGGRAHRHDAPDPPAAPPPPAPLDKHRLPPQPTLPQPPAGPAAVPHPAGAWASAEGSIEAPPPRQRA